MTATNSVALDLAPIIAWIVAAMTVINFIILMKGVLSAGEKKLEERIKSLEAKAVDPERVTKLETKAVEYDRRIQAVENETKHLPDKDSVHRQQLDIVEMKGEIGSIKKSIEATERTTRRVEDFLMKGSA